MTISDKNFFTSSKDTAYSEKAAFITVFTLGKVALADIKKAVTYATAFGADYEARTRKQESLILRTSLLASVWHAHKRVSPR